MSKSSQTIVSVPKGDSAYLYFILESYEGIASYSTLEHKVGDLDRKIEIRIPPGLEAEFDVVLRRLMAEIRIGIDPA